MNFEIFIGHPDFTNFIEFPKSITNNFKNLTHGEIVDLYTRVQPIKKNFILIHSNLSYEQSKKIILDLVIKKNMIEWWGFFKNFLMKYHIVFQKQIIFGIHPNIVNRVFITKNIKKQICYYHKKHMITISYFEYGHNKLYYFESKKSNIMHDEDNKNLIHFLIEDTFTFNVNCIDNIFFVPSDLNPDCHIFRYVEKIGKTDLNFKFLIDFPKLYQIHKLLNFEHRKNALFFWEIFKNIADNSAIEKVFNNEYLKREIMSFV